MATRIDANLGSPKARGSRRGRVVPDIQSADLSMTSYSTLVASDYCRLSPGTPSLSFLYVKYRVIGEDEDES